MDFFVFLNEVLSIRFHPKEKFKRELLCAREYILTSLAFDFHTDKVILLPDTIMYLLEREFSTSHICKRGREFAKLRLFVETASILRGLRI